MNTVSGFITHIRENPDDYPLTNVRWTHGLLWFGLLPAAVLLAEEGLYGAIAGAAFGIGFCLYISLLTYGLERYQDSLPARVTLAAVTTVLVTLVLVLVGALLIIAADAITTVISPWVAVLAVPCLIFAGILYYLS